MPEKFLKILELIKDQLFYNSDRIVVLDEPRWVELGLDKTDVQLAVGKLEKERIVLKQKVWNLFKEESIPTTSGDRGYMLEHEDNHFDYYRHGAKPSEFKYQVILEISKDFDNYYKEVTSRNKKETNELSFDSMNGVLASGGSVYKLTSKLRQSIFAFLWERRRVFKDSQIIVRGTPWQKESIAVQAGLIESAKDFHSAEEKFKQEIAQLNRIFRGKKFPLKITTRGGVQLIETK